MRRLTGTPQTATLVALAVFTTIACTTPHYFLTGQNLTNVARQVALDAPLVLGQTLVLITGGIDISVGSTMAMAAAITIGLQPWGTAASVLAALVFGSGVGALNGFLVTRAGIVPFVATLGTMSLIRGLLLTYTKQRPLSGTDDAFTFWGGGSLGGVPTPALIVLILLAGLSLFLSRTRLGRDFYAVGGNRESAFTAGIAVARSQFIAFVLCGALAALSGVLLASRLNSATVQLGQDTALLSVAAALIGGSSLLGGRGTVLGALIGLAALGMLANGMNLLGIHTHFQIALKAIILIAVVALDALSRRLARRDKLTAVLTP